MLKISRDHPTLQLEPKIQQISNSFLAQHGFNYFQYLRSYNDGSYSLLTNHTGLLKLFAENALGPMIYSSFTPEHENLHSYWFLWDEELPALPVNLAKEKFNHHHGMTLLRRSKNYYDMIAVALNQRRNNIASFYLTKQKAIEEFISAFDKNHRPLIDDICKKRVVLPEFYRDVNYQKICLENKNIEVQGVFGPVHITSQELACLRLLTQGATYKEIGKVLTLSPRTVETYITRIKQRSGFTRAKLSKLLTHCQG